MITLVSRWELLDGCPPALTCELDGLADKVKSAEPDTLAYLVYLQAPGPLDANGKPIDPPPAPIPMTEQTSVTFVEVYADACAFNHHLEGAVFQTFLKDFGKYFKQDPQHPGWPITQNGSYSNASGFIRPTAGTASAS